MLIKNTKKAKKRPETKKVLKCKPGKEPEENRMLCADVCYIVETTGRQKEEGNERKRNNKKSTGTTEYTKQKLKAAVNNRSHPA